MPELPEVETVRRGLAPLVRGRQVVDAGGHPSAKFASAADARGATILDVHRRGKYLVLPLDDDRNLVIHLGMTGQLRVDGPVGGARGTRSTGPAGGHPADPYDRAWWLLDDGGRLALRDIRRFGRVAILPTDGSRDHTLPTFAALGPEPFGEEFTPASLHAALNGRSARIKTQLLSQRPVAGVGNIYADEALWRARVHPGARSISRPAAARLHAAIVEVLAAGIRNGGTTLRDYRTVDGGTGENQHHLECYGRSGEPCTRCGTVLRRSVIDGRGTTHCPRCQRL